MTNFSNLFAKVEENWIVDAGLIKINVTFDAYFYYCSSNEEQIWSCNLLI